MKDKHVLCICRLPDIGAFRKLKGATKSSLLRELFLVSLFQKDHFPDVFSLEIRLMQNEVVMFKSFIN